MTSITAFNARARQELRRCLKGKTPWNRERDLSRAAERFRQKKGWRGEIPEVSVSWATALAEIASDQPVHKQRGRRPGTFHYPERPYVDRAYMDLIRIAARHGRPDWIAELFSRGSTNRPSRGRRLVTTHALRIAEAEGVHLSKLKVAVLVRKRAAFWIDGVI